MQRLTLIVVPRTF